MITVILIVIKLCSSCPTSPSCIVIYYNTNNSMGRVLLISKWSLGQESPIFFTKPENSLPRSQGTLQFYFFNSHFNNILPSITYYDIYNNNFYYEIIMIYFYIHSLSVHCTDQIFYVHLALLNHFRCSTRCIWGHISFKTIKLRFLGNYKSFDNSIRFFKISFENR